MNNDRLVSNADTDGLSLRRVAGGAVIMKMDFKMFPGTGVTANRD